jgi:hypothetical protein
MPTLIPTTQLMFYTWLMHFASTAVKVIISTGRPALLYIPKHHATFTIFFLKNNRSGNNVGQDWKLRMTDMKKQHLEG